MCSVVLLWSIVYVILILLVTGCFSSCIKMLSNGSFLVCLCSWSQRYCSADICVGFTGFLFCVTSLPVFLCKCGMIFHDDSDCLSLQTCHGSMVLHLPVELLQ